MNRAPLRRAAAILLSLSLALAFAWGVSVAGYRQALTPLRERGEADLALTVDRLTGQLQRYQDMAVLMAGHPFLSALSEAPESAELRVQAQDLLLAAADRTTALDLLYMSDEGEVLASARPDGEGLEGGVPGAVAQRALSGALGSGIGPAGPDRPRSYLFAAPRFDPRTGGVQGLLVVAVDIDHVEQAWRGDRPAVFFTDATGEVFVTNRSELLFGRLTKGRFVWPGGASVALDRGVTGGHEIWRADLGPYLPAPALRLSRGIPQVGLQATALIDVAPARRLALLQGAVAGLILLAFAGALFWATERRRVLARANAQLESRVAARTAELSATNKTLRREVAERQEAEAALKRAQAELVQAGKLSALGQMSAGLSHELNQPLMAIRQFAENGSLLVDRGRTDQAAQNLVRIGDLAGRMGRIIRNLRAFARQESEPARRVDLVQVVSTALEMTEARLAKEGIALTWKPPERPVAALAGEVRLVQVLVNLITNAADAMSGRARRELTIEIAVGPRPVIRVSDTGPGIAQPERIFDPFYSTKEVGASEGMGLGLSISYGLVQSFGGAIRGRNRPEGGAVFSVELEPAAETLAAQ
ncbi:C4-dicarboxylate transport sensor protein [Pseudooceanicola batsensis HTCC2597]|uniref:C4-dicarboxylate transport sensor protein DctB n=1 Tax=Pseudooceanicola batsensis (strain ATCC BAA-863 / DSM 15984 / KCTC 12145 / HTCC2597) TaxID=252305 RepID=A3TSV8_PSEBH|nr:ATP-binding protein [Pseudooceanicola batsensis]EAQ04735.1 C4-dicarboxylate transport sensor protein [Pseudooceanicola batsensis HTCC2597]